MTDLKEDTELVKEMSELDTSPLDDKFSKKFPWKKLSDEDLIYSKAVDNDQDHEGSKGRWKKSALLDRKPREGTEGRVVTRLKGMI